MRLTLGKGMRGNSGYNPGPQSFPAHGAPSSFTRQQNKITHIK